METYYQEPAPQRTVKAMKKSGKLGIALLGILLGAVLLFIGNRAGKNKTGEGDSGTSAPPADTRTVEEYREDLERRASQLCADVAGVGDVSILIMLEGGYEYVYAYDKRVTASGESTSYITVGSGDGESLVYLTERAPPILGIGVVCTGGGNAEVKREVTALLSAAFGVGANKIYVTERK